MKKFALISGLLFLVVFFWVNTFTKEESSFDVEYPLVNVNALTNEESSSEAELQLMNAGTLSSTEMTGTTAEAEPQLMNAGTLSSTEMTGTTYEAEPQMMNAGTLSSTEMTGTTSEADLASQNGNASRGPRTYIIIASFGDLEHARLTAEAYTVKYQSEILVLPPTPNGNYRISYGSYSSSGEAIDALGTVRQAGFPDAWVLAPR